MVAQQIIDRHHRGIITAFLPAAAGLLLNAAGFSADAAEGIQIGQVNILPVCLQSIFPDHLLLIVLHKNPLADIYLEIIVIH
jgi:hypothetical protein